MDAKPINKIFLFLLVFAGVAVYIAGLFPEVSIDAGKYAAVSRHIYESGDWLHLKIHGDPYMQKPHLLFWLSAASFHLFGMSMFAFKFPTLLFSVLGVYSTYRLAKNYYSPKVAFLAMIIYATSQMLFLYSNDLHTDALLTANVMFSIWQFSAFLKSGKLLNFILAFTGAGLAMITKGPIGLAIPAFAVGSHLIATRNWRQLLSPVWLAGIPILGVILFPVLKGNYDAFGWEGIEFFFWTNNAGRITGDYVGSNVDYFFYLHTMLYIFLPWSLFALGALWWQTRYLKFRKYPLKVRPEYYTYGTLIIYTVILSIARQKAPHYFFPMIPLLSVIVADFVNKVSTDPALKKWHRFLLATRTLIVVLMWVLLLLIMAFIFPSNNLFLWMVTALCFGFFIFSFRLFHGVPVLNLVIPMVVAAISLNMMINTHFFPEIYKYQGVIQASYRYNNLAEDNDRIYSFLTTQFEDYYYPKRVAEKLDSQVEADSVFNQLGGWVITTREGRDFLKERYRRNLVYEELFLHKKISKMNWKFLNPNTRHMALKEIFLLKIDSNSEISQIVGD
ncbi:ArnT family glycosyltransferase [Marinilabilia sp.]